MATQEVALRSAGQQMSRFEQREVIETIKQTVCKGATDAQLKMFLEVCKATGLDPFLKEIWYVAEKGIIMAGRDGYLRVANEHPMFDGIETRVERDNNKIPIKAVCTVWRKDRNHPTVCEAYYSEYKKGSPVWQQYPSAMISKVAEVLALKRSFAINGVVSEEEIGNDAPPAPRETPKAVADRKIAEMRGGKSYAEVSQEQPEVDPVQDAEPQPSTLDQVLATFVKLADISAAYAELKPHFLKVLDQSTWDQICLEHKTDGVKVFGTVGNAKKCFRALWTALEQARNIPADEPTAPEVVA